MEAKKEVFIVFFLSYTSGFAIYLQIEKEASMRTIEISTEVFAELWALRGPGEESENEILERVLEVNAHRKIQEGQEQEAMVAKKGYMYRGPRTWSQPTWATDLAESLEELGGTAKLQEIYDVVRRIRKAAGRSLPPSLKATVRRTLENHSSDSENYTGGADLFAMPDGKGAGVWSLR
ncbi:MAG: hypothetical protein KUG65_05795 [Sphingomonadaceae bacterium]|nr:hypothetical protein [Sphingomonadaceae bacterium]